MSNAPSISEWTEEAVLAVAMLTPALAANIASVDCCWPFPTALELEGHHFDGRVNRCTIQPIATPRSAFSAYAAAAHITAVLRHGTHALPVFGLHVGGLMLAAFVLPLFLLIGLPVGLVASILTDWWLGEGIYRGIAQCTVGMWHDACTQRIEVPPGGPERWVRLFEALLLPAPSSSTCSGEGSASVSSDSTVASPSSRAHRFAALQQRVRERRRQYLLEPNQPLFAFAPSDSLWQVPSFDAYLFRATFPPTALLQLQISGGGLRDHNFDVAELQVARRAFHVLWIVADCRDALASFADRDSLSSLWASLPDAARLQAAARDEPPAGPPLVFSPACQGSVEPLLM
jgi:hypothetical protein